MQCKPEQSYSLLSTQLRLDLQNVRTSWQARRLYVRACVHTQKYTFKWCSTPIRNFFPPSQILASLVKRSASGTFNRIRSKNYFFKFEKENKRSKFLRPTNRLFFLKLPMTLLLLLLFPSTCPPSTPFLSRNSHPLKNPTLQVNAFGTLLL